MFRNWSLHIVLATAVLAPAATLPSNQVSALPDQVTAGQAVQEGIEKNLGLLAERYNLSIADARIVQARLRPNPVFTAGLDYQDILGSGFTTSNNNGPAEYNFRTDFLLERGGKRKYRIEVAENARSVAQLQLQNSIRGVVLDVENAFVDVLLAKESLALARENLKSFNGIVEINSVRVKNGDLAEVELLRSRVATLQFQNAVRQAELRLRTAKYKLQLAMGRTVPSDTFDVVGQLRRDREPVGAPELRTQALQLRPDLLALQRDQARSLADVRLQLAQGKVDYTVGTEFHHQYGGAISFPARSMGFFFSAPLPVFNRNQGEIERARQEHQQLEARIRALTAVINNEVDTAHQQYATARGMLETIEREMLQQARDVRDTTDYAYRRGEASFVEFLDAQRAFNDTMQSYNDARAEYARALYLIDSVSGQAVNP